MSEDVERPGSSSLWREARVSLPPLPLAILALVAAMLAWEVSSSRERWRDGQAEYATSLQSALDLERVKPLAGDTGARASARLERFEDQLAVFGSSIPEFRSVEIFTIEGRSDWKRIAHAGAATPPIPSARLWESARWKGKPEVLIRGGQDGNPPEVAIVQALRNSRDGVWGMFVIRRIDSPWARRWDGFSSTLPSAIVLLLVLVALTLRVFRKIRKGNEFARSRREAIPAIVLVVGLVLIAWVWWNMRRYESDGLHVRFRDYAQSELDFVAHKLSQVGDEEIEAITRYFAGDMDIDPGQFGKVAGMFSRTRCVTTWKWASRVDSSRRASYEALNRKRLQGGSIWSWGPSGEIVPAPHRSWHLPVAGISPVPASRDRIGRDLMTDSVLHGAFLEAVATGSAVSRPSEEIPGGQDRGEFITVVHPAPSDASGLPRGFCLTRIHLPSLLRGGSRESDLWLSIEYPDPVPGNPMRTVRIGGDPEVTPERHAIEASIPFFGFGQSFRIAATPTDSFLREGGPRVSWIFLSIALPLCLLVALALFLIQRKRDLLEQRLEQRSRDLARSEESYRAQFADNSAPMLLIDPRTKIILEANQAAVRFYGWSRDELLEKTSSDLSVDDDTPIASFPRKPGALLEVRHRLADGRIRDVEISASFVEMGNRIVLHSIIHDVTARKTFERERRELEQRLEWALESAGDGIWDWKIGLGRVAHNHRWCDILGLDDSFLEHALEVFAQRIHKEDRDPVMDRIQACLEGKGPYSSQHRMIHSEGRVVWVLDRGDVVEHDSAGSPVRMVGSITDITERKKAEDQLREASARSRLAMDLARLAHWEYDFATRTFHFNEQFYSLYGTTSEEQGGDTMSAQAYIERLVDPDDRDKLLEAVGNATKGEDEAPTFSIEHRARKVDGTLFHVAVQWKMTRDAEGKPLRAIGATQDITERRRAEMVLEEMNRNLEATTAKAGTLAAKAEMASRAKSEFLANMSHEIRTPLNGILGMTGLLLDTRLDDRQRHCAEVVRHSGESLLRILNDILDLSKIEAGHLELEAIEFDLVQIVEDIASVLAVRSHEKGIEFVFSSSPAIPRILRGDPSRLRQILLNLAGNSVKFTTEGQVSIRSEIESESEDRICLRFSVKDTGIGIPREKIGTLFQKFVQVDASTSRKYGGTGLGLAICRQLVEMMGGEIRVESELGGGSEFRFTAWFEKAKGADEEDPLPESVRNGNILVLDDDVLRRSTLVERLESWGLAADADDPGEAAIARIASARSGGRRYGTVIVELGDRGMAGIQTLLDMHSGVPADECRLVVVTPIASKADQESLRECGVDKVLNRPFKLSHLRRALIDLHDSTSTMDESSSGAPDSRFELGRRFAPGARILLVEDNSVNQMVALGILEAFGLRADVAGNGLEALDALRNLPYDLVLMDVQMPEMDGFETTQRIRGEQAAVLDPMVPIIAMTANAMQGDREACIEAGMNGYISKPVDPQELSEALSKWIGTTKTEAGVPTTPRGSDDELDDVAIFDRNALLERVLGNEKLFERLLQVFFDSMPRELDTLDAALSGGDQENIVRCAHAIKGSAGNVAAMRMARVATELEKRAQDGTLSDPARDRGLIRAEFDMWRSVTRRPA